VRGLRSRDDSCPLLKQTVKLFPRLLTLLFYTFPQSTNAMMRTVLSKPLAGRRQVPPDPCRRERAEVRELKRIATLPQRDIEMTGAKEKSRYC
jgi:hypothetical protein